MRKDNFLPDAGGLSGVKRLQMQERGVQSPRMRPAPAPHNTGIVPPHMNKRPAPVGYESGTRLQALAQPNFPRRRGQGLR